jgi:hypothetical protein
MKDNGTCGAPYHDNPFCRLHCFLVGSSGSFAIFFSKGLFHGEIILDYVGEGDEMNH